MTDGTGTTTYAYDALYRPVSVTDGVNNTVGYSYNAAGRRASITYPDATTATYGFDAGDQLTSVKDWNNNTSTYSYDDAGRLTTTTFANGVVESRSYDNADNLLSVAASKDATAVSDASYTIDALGNRTQVTDGTSTTNYTYDNLYRLTGVTYPGADTRTYSYDSNGNRQTLVDNGTPTNYSYDAADQMTLAGALTYTYDNNGNQTASGTDTFTYDAENRLTSSNVAGIPAAYSYNGDGLRERRVIGGVTVGYSWDVARQIPVVLTDTDGNKYVYGLALISMTTGANTYYYQHDGLGSTSAITDATGRVVNSYAYDAFGSIRLQLWHGQPTDFRFAGEQADPSGLLYLRARYYDPSTGRFTSPDPVQSGNRYDYVHDNPLNLNDPSGLFPCPGCGTLKKAAGAVRDYAESIDWQTTGWDALALGCAAGVVVGAFTAPPAAIAAEGCVIVAGGVSALRNYYGAQSCTISRTDFIIGMVGSIGSMIPGAGPAFAAGAVAYDIAAPALSDPSRDPAPGCDPQELSSSSRALTRTMRYGSEGAK